MRLLVLILFSLIPLLASANNECPCAAQTAKTEIWKKSKQGNEYCTRLTNTGKVTREYRKYFGVKPPKDPPKGKTWTQVRQGFNKGKWYLKKV